MVKSALELNHYSTDGLYRAVEDGNCAEVKKYLKWVPMTLCHRRDQNLLLIALKVDNDYNRNKVFNYLVKKGADMRYREKKTGMDVLAWAAHLGRAQQVETIIKLTGRDLDFLRADVESRTALHHAVLSGDPGAVLPILRACVKYRLNVDVCDNNGLTPYILARKLGYTEIAKMLVELGKASAFKFDSKSFRSAEEWAAEGVRERVLKARKHVMSTQNIRFRGFLGINAKASRLPTIIVTTSKFKSYVVDLSLKTNFMGHSLRDLDDSKALRSRTWARLRDGDVILQQYRLASEQHALAQLPLSTPVTIDTRARKQAEPDLDEPDFPNRKDSTTGPTLNDLMRMLSDQSTVTYRPGAKPPEPPKTSAPPSPLNETRMSSLLGVSLGRSDRFDRVRRRAASRAASRVGGRPERAQSRMASPDRAGRKLRETLPPIKQ